ncbi:class I SAM-dependent methyltransferase [Rhodobacterales bacterium]|nr:class I SAM-dependent methyltransferase [Rhodobacterales bacterium]
MYQTFHLAASSIVKQGDLHVTDPSGRVHHYGDGTGTPVKMRLSPGAPGKIVKDPDLYLGECYMTGDLQITEGSVYDMIEVFLANIGSVYHYPSRKSRLLDIARRALRRLDQHNPAGRSRSNVAHHYDLSRTLYDLFLDSDRQYSCAYFERQDTSLEEAQLAKKRHIAAKLNIAPGMRVLDIGSGWGGLALYLAEICGAKVHGVTLSTEQLELARARAEERGLSDRVTFDLIDYRSLTGTYDRIVSVGMFEHVGVGQFKSYFRKLGSLLAENGVGLVHSINRSDGPGSTSAWIKKYIFPGGYIPALSEVVPHLEHGGLYISDIEILRLHYAETLHVWAERFAARRNKAREIYDEEFCRMWEFYLAASECAFRYGGMNNFQIQFVRNQTALPLTRTYMPEEEERLRTIDSGLLREQAAE